MYHPQIPRTKKAEQTPAQGSTPRMTMTVEEMGVELGISRTTAYHLAQQPDFPSFMIGKRILISREGLRKWIEKQHTAKNPEVLRPLEK